ncbi:MAG: hypothetical protein ACI9MC_001925 [Kiritimatiellia bacterium]
MAAVGVEQLRPLLWPEDLFMSGLMQQKSRVEPVKRQPSHDKEEVISQSNMDVQDDMDSDPKSSGILKSMDMTTSFDLQQPSPPKKKSPPPMTVSTNLSDPQNLKDWQAPESPFRDMGPEETRSNQELGTELMKAKGKDHDGVFDPRVRSDEQAKILGFDQAHDGYFQPEKGENDKFESKRHQDVHDDLDNKSTDETYLKRSFQSDKTFERNGKLEHQRTLDQKTPKALEKLRKLAARSTAAMDDHVHGITQVQAMTGGAVEELREKRDKQLEQLSDSLKSKGDEDPDYSLDNKRRSTKLTSSKYEIWRATLADLDSARVDSSNKADAADKDRKWLDDWEVGLKKDPKLPSDGLIKDGHAKVDRILADRKQTKRNHDAATRVMGEMKTDKLVNDGIVDKLLGYGKKGMGKTANFLVNKLSFGMVSYDEDEIEGGRKKKFGLNFQKPVTEFKKHMSEVKELRKRGVMGGKNASNVYSFLKLLSEGVLAPLRSVLTSLTLWCTILALFTLGGTLPVAAATGAAALFLTLFKVVIDLGLTVWSGIRANQLKDHDPRSEDLANFEAINHGVDLAVGGFQVGLGVGLGVDVENKSLGPNKLMGNRFKDLKGNNTETKYSSIGKGKGSTTLGMKIPTVDSKGSVSVTTDQLVDSSMGKGMVKGGQMIDKKLVKSRGEKGRQRNDEVFSGRNDLKMEPEKNGSKVLDGVDRKATMMRQALDNITSKSTKAVQSVDPKKLNKDEQGDPNEDLAQLASVSELFGATFE